jgi:uncharacterized protein (TIGR02145 family)
MICTKTVHKTSILKSISAFVLILVLFNTASAQVTNVAVGNWSNPFIWINNHIPTGTDSVYLSNDVIVDMNCHCNALSTNGHNITINAGITFNVLNNPHDIDGHVYNTVTIGTQVWLQRNLDVSHYRNGDTIPEVTDPNVFDTITTGAWSYYNNSPANEAIYGKLYNWYAVNDLRGLAPQGWHVPGISEWTSLVNYVHGYNSGGALMDTSALWIIMNTGATNSSGFTGLPGGAGFEGTSQFYANLGYAGYWWSATEQDTAYAGYCSLSQCCGTPNYSNVIVVDYNRKVNGQSVRCVRD